MKILEVHVFQLEHQPASRSRCGRLAQLRQLEAVRADRQGRGEVEPAGDLSQLPAAFRADPERRGALACAGGRPPDGEYIRAGRTGQAHIRTARTSHDLTEDPGPVML